MKKFLYSSLITAAFLVSCGETASTEDVKEDTVKSDVSVKGAWNDADLKTMNDEVLKVEDDLAAFGDKKQEFIDCYTEKVEESYDNFTEANKDGEGCAKLATDCASQLF